MKTVEFDFRQDTGPKDENHLKCNGCGHEAIWDKNRPYEPQSTCPHCHGGMMGWAWDGWKQTRKRKAYWRQREELRKNAKPQPVSQDSEPFANFTVAERTIHNLLVVEGPGTEAPWLSEFGVCYVKVQGMRRNGDKVEFGISNEDLPIIGWVQAKDFHNEWPE